MTKPDRGQSKSKRNLNEGDFYFLFFSFPGSIVLCIYVHT